MPGPELRPGKPINTSRHAFSLGILFPVGNSGDNGNYHAPPPGGDNAIDGPADAVPGPSVTPPVMPGIMDHGYLDARSRDGLVRTHPRPARRGYDDAGGLTADERP